MNSETEANKKIKSSHQDQISVDEKNTSSSECKPIEKAIAARRNWILEAAYFKSETREYEAGDELSDWLEAEKEYAEMKVTLFLSVFEEDEATLTIVDLQRLAGFVGVQQPERLRLETELVREIQNACIHLPCFQTNNESCNETDCHWRAMCRKLVAVWLR